jgi:hypothetical protein
MPRVRESFQYCVFYLFGVNPLTGEGIGPGATGAFIAKYSVDLACETHIYAATNRHCIESHWTNLRINTCEGKTRLIETDPLTWTLSDSCDLAILDVTDLIDDETDQIGFVYTQDFLTPKRIKQYSVGIGGDVVMIGLFADRAGGDTNMPVGRFGNIAAMPDPKHAVKVTKADVRSSPSFLNDMRSRSGFSGSPVWVWRMPGNDLGYYNPYGGDASKSPIPGRFQDGRVFAHTFLCFLGLHRAQFLERTTILSSKPELPANTEIEIASSMTVVVPAWEIEELLRRPNFVEERVNRDQRPERKERAEGRVRIGRAEDWR